MKLRTLKVTVTDEQGILLDSCIIKIDPNWKFLGATPVDDDGSNKNPVIEHVLALGELTLGEEP